MSKRKPYRQHSNEFKIQICREIREGIMGRRETMAKYKLSSALLYTWLTRFDQGELELPPPEEIAQVAEYEAKIAALERKVGQLLMELDEAKKSARPRLIAKGDAPLIISGPPVSPSVVGVK